MTAHHDSTAALLISQGARILSAAKVESARLEAEVLLRHVLELDRTQLFMRLQSGVDPAVAENYFSLVRRRTEGEPLAYLVGAREFMGHSFKVGPGVLVPRPETELLVEWATARVPEESGIVVDVGTGSGAIILSLALASETTSGARFVGNDISRAALSYAARNRAALRLEDRVDLVHGNLLDWIDRPVDLICANLPYLTADQIASNSELAPEPREALLGGDEGLDLIRALLEQAQTRLNGRGSLIAELDPGHAEQARGVAARVFPDRVVKILNDLAGRARFLTVAVAPGD